MSKKFKKQSKIGGLVLTRRVGEKVIINGGEVVIEVVQIRENAVRIAFKAAKEVNIQRAEVSDEENSSHTR